MKTYVNYLLLFFMFLGVFFVISYFDGLLCSPVDKDNRDIPQLLQEYEKLEQNGEVLIEIGKFINKRGKKYIAKIPEISGHIYGSGTTGHGKSTYLTSMTTSLLFSDTPNSICVIEPHFSYAKDLAAFAYRYTNYKIFHLTASGLDLGYITPFSMQKRLKGFDYNQQASFILSSLQQEFTNIDTSYVMKLTLLSGLELLGAKPIMLYPDIFSSKKLRHKLLNERYKDLNRSAKRFFRDYEKLSPSKQRAQVDPSLNKIQNLLGDRSLLLTLNQPEDLSICIESIINTPRSLLLVDLNRANSSTASVLGSLAVNTIKHAIFRRKANDPNTPVCFLFADEFQSYCGGGSGGSSNSLTISELLSEARKFRIQLVLTNQYADQVSGRLKQELSVNCGIHFSFQIPSKEAKFFGNVFGSDDIVPNLPKYRAMFYDKRFSKYPAMYETTPVDIPNCKPNFASTISLETAKRNVDKLIQEVEAIQDEDKTSVSFNTSTKKTKSKRQQESKKPITQKEDNDIVVKKKEETTVFEYFDDFKKRFSENKKKGEK